MADYSHSPTHCRPEDEIYPESLEVQNLGSAVGQSAEINAAENSMALRGHDLSVGQCTEPALKTAISEPERGEVDVEALHIKVERVVTLLERVRDDVQLSIAAHRVQSANVVLAYAMAHDRHARLAATEASSAPPALLKLTATILSQIIAGPTGWFIGMLLGSVAGGEVKTGVQTLNTALSYYLGRGIFDLQPFETPAAADIMPPSLFQAQIEARSAALAHGQLHQVMVWMKNMRPMQDDPLSFVVLDTLDIAAVQQSIDQWAASETLLEVPETIDVPTLANEFEARMWRDWLLSSFETQRLDPTTRSLHGPIGGGGAATYSPTLSKTPSSDQVIARIRELAPIKYENGKLADFDTWGIADRVQRDRLYQWAADGQLTRGKE